MGRIHSKKKVRKSLLLFKTIYKINPPYFILLDPEFIFEALQNKIFLRDSLPKLLQESSYPVVTSCIYGGLKQLGEDYKGAALVAKRLQRVSCAHHSPQSPNECILSLLNNTSTKKYCVGVVNEELKKTLRRISGVPIITVWRRSLILEPLIQKETKTPKQIEVQSGVKKEEL